MFNSIDRGLIVELIFNIQFDVWILVQNFIGDQKQEGVDVGGPFCDI